MKGSFTRLSAFMLSLVLLFSAGALPRSVVHAEENGFAPMASGLLAEDLFVDDFEDGNANGWSGSGYAVVTEGSSKTLKYTYTAGSSTTKYAAAGDAAWTSYSVEARLRNGNEDNATGLHARYANANNFYGLRLDLKNDVVYLLRVVNGSSSVLDSAPMTLNVNTFYKLRLDLDGSSLTGYVDDVQVIAATDSSLVSGLIAFGGYSKSNYSIDDVRVTALRVPASMTVGPQNAVILEQESRQFSATVYDQGNQIISGLPLSWSSDAPSIATVDGNGLVQGVAAGSTTIRAGYGAIEASAVVTVQGTSANPPYSANKTLAPIVADGLLNESVWSVDRSVTKLVVGATENSAQFGALWDEKYLYVGVKVLDTQLFNDSTGNFDDDSVEVFVDADHNHGTVYDLKDWQFSKSYGDTGLWEKLSETAGVKHGWSAITGGYAVELAIPWINLGLVAESGLDIGFDIAVNDDDNGGVRDGQLVWAGIANNYQNTASFGDLILSANEVGTPVTPPAPVQADRYVTPQGAGSKNGTSWSNAMQGDKVGGLQAAWAETGPTSTLHVGSGSYAVPQTLNMTSGGLDVLNMKKLTGVNTGGGLPEFTGDFQLTNQVNRSFITVPIGVSYWTVQNIVIRNYYNGIYANGQHEGIRILNVSVHDMSDGIYLWGRATRSNPDAGSHDIVIKDGEYTNFTKSAVRFRNGNYLASVINVTADAGGQANWAPGNFPMGFRIGNSPEQAYIFDHDIVFQDVVSKNSWHENGTDYWNGDGFTAERQAYNITYLRSKAFGSTDGGWDDKSIDPVLIGTVAFGNKRNYRFWDNPTMIQAVGGYSFKRGGSGDAPGLWVGSGTGKADVYFSTFFNNQHSEIALEGSSNEVNLYDSIVGKTNGTSLYSLNGGQLTATDTEQYIQGVQGTNPQLVNGANDEWDGEGNDFNSLVYGNTKGYFQQGQNVTPYTVQIDASSLTLGLYENVGVSAQVYDENDNPVADLEKLIWYVDDGYKSRLLQSRGENAVVQGLNPGVTELVAVYKGAEARISVTVTP